MWLIQQIVSQQPSHKCCIVSRSAKPAGWNRPQYWAKIFLGSKLSANFERLSRLVEFSSNANSPGLIPVVEADLEATVPIVVYPFVEAQTLPSWLNSRSQFPCWMKLIELVRQLLEALNRIHLSGMAHGQLNLDHILITQSDQSLRLIGLGCVERIGEYMQLSRPVSQFDAPEIRTGVFEVCSAIDVYAVGRLMIELFGNSAAKWPIVQAMTSTKARNRPTSSELLLLLEDLESRLKAGSNRTANSMFRAA